MRKGEKCVLEGFFFFCHLFRKWIEHSKLREINFRVVEFNPMVLKGKIRPDSSRPELLQPVSRTMQVLGTVLGDTLVQYGVLASGMQME